MPLHEMARQRHAERAGPTDDERMPTGSEGPRRAHRYGDETRDAKRAVTDRDLRLAERQGALDRGGGGRIVVDVDELPADLGMFVRDRPEETGERRGGDVGDRIRDRT